MQKARFPGRYRARWLGQTRAQILVAALFLVSGLVGCAAAPPNGPLFVGSTNPGPEEALVYIYRTEPLRGIGAFDLRLDSDGLGRLGKGQYLSFLLAPGHHDLAARLRWAGVVPLSWNRLGFIAKPGQTIYLRVAAGYVDHSSDASSPRKASGGNTTGGVAILLSEQRAEAAIPQLTTMHRAARD